MEACRDAFAAPKKPNRLASGALSNDVDHSRAHPTDSAAQDYSNGEFDPVKVQPRRPQWCSGAGWRNVARGESGCPPRLFMMCVTRR
jgi:hypothetical protein